VNDASEKETISSRTREWFAVEAQRDMEASLAYMTPDVIIHAEGAPAVVGLDAAKALYEDFFKIPFIDLEFLPREIQIAESGEIAYDVGPFNYVFDGDDGPTRSPAKSLLIWRKVDGEWKSVALAFTGSTPPEEVAG
jgi:ketosteroid isomerase-like protein